MPLTTYDVSSYTQRKYADAESAWRQSSAGAERRQTYRRMMVLLADRVHNIHGRPNGIGVIPFLVTHPNMGDDSVTLANVRTVTNNLPDGEMEECRVRHWATPCVYYAVPLTHANIEYLSAAHVSIDGYPILNESDWSEVEMEMIDEAIDAYWLQDVRLELYREHDIDLDHNDAFESAVREWLATHDDSPEVIGPDVRFPHIDDRLIAMVRPLAD